MAVEGSQPLKISLICSIDLAADVVNSAATAHVYGQYTFVKVSTTASASHYAIGEAVPITAATDYPIGILQNRPTKQGQMAEVVVVGRSKLYMSSTAPPLPGAAIGAFGAAQGVAYGGCGQGVTIGVASYTKVAVGFYLPQLANPGAPALTVAAADDLGTVIINCLNPIPGT